ncbi:universal stress protein [Streptomyces sp. FH025]|uniref:universal stress protein n=1 Tax=Streptomyces sp. FH025 TaxID=2815937 RepID=UPI001A9CCB6C|nr:universal stress protein [Streptomyces sp. FH025]MBO1413087.1 universal stress protein [Streptomyces sp. FH025]
MPKEITVGLDGSPESLSAARWAAREAQLRGLPLRLLHLWILPPMTAQRIRREDEQAVAAERLLQDAEAGLRAQYPDVLITTQLLPADTPAALLPAAPDAELLVLGSQGLGTVRGYLLGSLGLHTVAQSDRPVVLVRAYEQPIGTKSPAARSGAVAVGVSLRQGYDGALEFAFDAANRRAVPLLAVHAAGHRPSVITREHPPGTTAQEADRQALAEALLPWRESYPDVHVVEHVSPDGPARAVVDIAIGAGLLVVGRGGYRTGPAPRIGPVAHAAIHHAACPVAVIPHD